MPKKDANKIRVPFNCLIAPVTKEAITGLQNETKESQGEIVDRAVALLAFGEEIAASKTKTPGIVVRSDAPTPIIRDNVVAASRPLKRPGVPEWKRSIRPKGDKTR